MGALRFGWHMPSFPMDGSDGATFVEQIHDFIRHIEPNFDSVWVDDHMFPGYPWNLQRHHLPGMPHDHRASSHRASEDDIWRERAVPVVSQPRAAGENGRQPPPAHRRALPLWHRRGLDGRRIQGVQLRLPQSLGAH